MTTWMLRLPVSLCDTDFISSGYPLSMSRLRRSQHNRDKQNAFESDL